MAKQINYTEKTLNYLRELGHTAQVVEKWVPSSLVFEITSACRRRDFAYAMKACKQLASRGNYGVRRDLFGFVDIIAICGHGEGILGVQSTSYALMTQHVKKIQNDTNDECRRWLESGNRVQVYGWKKYTNAVDRKFWRPTIESIVLPERSETEKPF